MIVFTDLQTTCHQSRLCYCRRKCDRCWWRSYCNESSHFLGINGEQSLVYRRLAVSWLCSCFTDWLRYASEALQSRWKWDEICQFLCTVPSNSSHCQSPPTTNLLRSTGFRVSLWPFSLRPPDWSSFRTLCPKHDAWNSWQDISIMRAFCVALH